MSSASIWSSPKRKRDKSSGSIGHAPAKQKPKEHKYKRLSDKSTYHHLHIVLSHKDKHMVEKQYRSLQKTLNWEFYLKNVNNQAQLPGNGYLPPVKKVFEISRRTFMCPFCPSHSYCFHLSTISCPANSVMNVSSPLRPSRLQMTLRGYHGGPQSDSLITCSIHGTCTLT